VFGTEEIERDAAIGEDAESLSEGRVGPVEDDADAHKYSLSGLAQDAARQIFPPGPLLARYDRDGKQQPAKLRANTHRHARAVHLSLGGFPDPATEGLFAWARSAVPGAYVNRSCKFCVTWSKG